MATKKKPRGRLPKHTLPEPIDGRKKWPVWSCRPSRRRLGDSRKRLAEEAQACLATAWVHKYIIPKGIVRFYNGRGTAEQWIKEGKYALNWTRLSCHKFVANQVRLWLFVLTYNLGNFMRRLVLPEDMKHWTLTSLQTRLIKTGGRLVRHARRLVFQLAEVLVTREMLTGILERISRLRLAPG